MSGAFETRVSGIEEFLNMGCERVDISSKITQSLIEELCDKDWKVCIYELITYDIPGNYVI